MKTTRLLFGLLLIGAGARAETPVYTLDECIQIGLERAVSVQNAVRDLDMADARIMQARAEGLPQASLSAAYSRSDGSSFAGSEAQTDSYSAGASLSQTLYSGGRVLAGIRAARAYRTLTRAALRQARAQLIRDIHIAFNDILLAEAVVAVRAASVAQLEEFAEQARQKYDAGTASEFDHLTAEVRLANERPALIEARNALAVARERFRNLIVLDSSDFELQGELQFDPFEPDMATLQAAAQINRPALLVQQQTIDLRREDLTGARAGYKPTLTASAAYTQENPDRYTNTDEWQGYWQAGLTARWTLFDGGTRRSESILKAQELAKAQAEFDDLQRAVSLDVTAARLDLRAARESVAGAAQTVRLAEKALEIAKTRYETGLSTYLEFTDSNLSLNTARLTRLQALHETMNAAVRLRYAAGLLDRQLDSGKDSL